MGAWESPIIIVSTGLLNTVNDSAIGGAGTGASGTSRFGGQLGKQLWVSSEQISQMYSSTIGTLYAGCYQYVKIAAAQTLVVGDLLYWDQAAATNTFTVTKDATTTTFNYESFAGFCINVITAGNYGFIQIAGVATGKYVSSITGTKAIGRPVMGSIATAGRIDVIDAAITGGTQNNFLGWALSLPTDNSLGTVQLSQRLVQRG
jgi:hypothetical protein